MRWEDGRKSITPTGMKRRDDKLHEQKFRKEKMENVLRNTLVLQENIRSSMTALATKESLKDLAAAEDLLHGMDKAHAPNQ